MSLLVGLLYGATLPMLPRRPILLGGVIAPILWSGLMHSILEVINPVMNQRIDWLWFVISQIGFGIVAGIVVSRQERIAPGSAFRSPFAQASRRPERWTRTTERTSGDEHSGAFLPRSLPRRLLHGAGVQRFPRPPGAGFGSHPRPARSSISISSTRRIAPACHGAEGKGGAAIALGDPVSTSPLPMTRRFAASSQTEFPAPRCRPSRNSAGGMLTDEQIDVTRTRNPLAGPSPDALRDDEPPPYAAQAPGDAAARRRRLRRLLLVVPRRRTAAEARRPARSWMARILPW